MEPDERELHRDCRCGNANLTDTSGPLPEKLVCADTSRRFFSVLGVLPLLGREFTLDEERFGGPAAALISEQLWRRRFAPATTS